MRAVPRLLIATDVAADATPIESILRQEFDEVSVSSRPEASVEDFDRCKPAVLVLAFQTLERSEAYYLGLYRSSPIIHGHPHQTVVLCNRQEMKRAYELCRQECFNDFIVYWPLTIDASPYRFLIAVHNAVRRLGAASAQGPTVSELAEQARRVGEMESVLERSLAEGGARIGAASRSLSQARADIGGAAGSLAHMLIEGQLSELLTVRDRAALERGLDEAWASEVGRRFGAMSSDLQPVEQWAQSLRTDLEPHIESARALTELARQVRPVVLVVDDDPFLGKTAGRMLEREGFEPMNAENGMSALAIVRRRRPDLILMDINMPGVDGIALTRVFKSTASLASIPIVMMTGESSREVVIACREAGASDFVVKPFQRETLRQKLSDALSRRGHVPPGGGERTSDSALGHAQLDAFIEQLVRRAPPTR